MNFIIKLKKKQNDIREILDNIDSRLYPIILINIQMIFHVFILNIFNMTYSKTIIGADLFLIIWCCKILYYNNNPNEINISIDNVNKLNYIMTFYSIIIMIIMKILHDIQLTYFITFILICCGILFLTSIVLDNIIDISNKVITFVNDKVNDKFNNKTKKKLLQ